MGDTSPLPPGMPKWPLVAFLYEFVIEMVGGVYKRDYSTILVRHIHLPLKSLVLTQCFEPLQTRKITESYPTQVKIRSGGHL
jgi:hypothetical protein